MMSEADADSGCESSSCMSKPLEEKTSEVGDRATLMAEDESYYNDSPRSSGAGQGGVPEEAEERSEPHVYQEAVASDKQADATEIAENETKSQQRAQSDAGTGGRDPSSRSRLRTPNKERRVYVGNLSYQVTWKDLKDYMRKCGSVIYADVLTEYNGMSKGCGVVEYSTKEEAQRAISELNDTQLLGRSIFVREDREEESKFGAVRSRRGRYGHYGGVRGVYPYGHDDTIPGDHMWNPRGAGGFQGGYNSFHRRMYYDSRPYSRGDGGPRYGVFGGYRDMGFRQRGVMLHQRRGFYDPAYAHQGYVSRSGGHGGQSYYYGHKNYDEGRSAQPFSSHRNTSPRGYYRGYDGSYPSGSEINTNDTGAYVNRDAAGMMHNYNTRGGGYPSDYNNSNSVGRYGNGD